MKRIIILFCAMLFFAPAVSQGGLMDLLKESAANQKVPAELIGTWSYTGYMNSTLVISAKDFTLNVYNRAGKLHQTFSGPMRNVNNNNHYLAPAISELSQDGASMAHLLKTGGPYYKIMYYKDLTADSVMIYIVNGYAPEKLLHSNDENSKLGRGYEKFVRTK
jgi:hypothetical protein